MQPFSRDSASKRIVHPKLDNEEVNHSPVLQTCVSPPNRVTPIIRQGSSFSPSLTPNKSGRTYPQVHLYTKSSRNRFLPFSFRCISIDGESEDSLLPDLGTIQRRRIRKRRQILARSKRGGPLRNRDEPASLISNSQEQPPSRRRASCIIGSSSGVYVCVH